MCHQNIYHYHILTVGRLNFPGKEAVIAIVPHWLHRIIYGKAAASLSIDDDLNVSLLTQEHLLAHHPMLEGVLLSECIRLKQRSLANKLTSLFQQFRGTELRLKLVWLCWYDLMLGNCLADWVESLKFKTSEEVNSWVNDRQAENHMLTSKIDEYICFAYRTVLDPLI